MIFYVMMTTELFIKYFCSIKLCCFWRFDDKLFVFKYCFKGSTPLHLSAQEGNTEMTKVLVEAGASLSAVDHKVIKPSVKLMQSNIKLFKWHTRNVI